MNYKNQIHDYIQEHKKEIIDTLKELIKIPSVRSETEENAPFGKECAKVLEFVNNLYKEDGFETNLNQNDGYLLSFYGEGKKSIGIFAHCDVVPAGDGWIYTNPFEPLEKNGCLIARGALDDKSAVLISLYCAKMLKELKLPFKSRLVMFSGGNEESGMQDIKNFLAKHSVPDFSLVVDSAFPLYRGNKGIIAFLSEKPKALSSGLQISGGTGATVIGKAVAVLPYSQPLFNELQDKKNEKITVYKDVGSIKVTATGIAKHSALPEGAESALAELTAVLCQLENLCESDRAVCKEIRDMSGRFYGEYFHIENNDEEFGKLSCVLTEIRTEDDGTVTVNYNIRHGSSISQANILNKINEKMEQVGFEKPAVIKSAEAHTLSRDNKYVKALLKTYSDYTCTDNPDPYINAGGTYRQYLKNAAEIGPTLKWDSGFDLPAGHGGVHQPDEFINIEGMLQAMELAMLMLLRIDEVGSGDFENTQYRSHKTDEKQNIPV